MENIFTTRDLEQINNKGISIDKIEKQLYYYKNGIPKIKLMDCATVSNGIVRPTEKEKEAFIKIFEDNKLNTTIEKFVPASGAASRMFKFLIEFLQDFDSKNETINAYINRTGNKNLAIFQVGFKNFPFYSELLKHTKNKFPNFSELVPDEKFYLLVKTMLSDKAFNFAEKPKGILPFHYKENRIFTPVDEHLNETQFYAKPKSKSKVHFTITKEFEKNFEEIVKKYPNVEVSYSYQKDNTDTLGLNLDLTPFRLENNDLFFRPGGHGALIENLNNLKSDVVFIKNIDNVAQNHVQEILSHKKLLGGILFKIQEDIFSFIQKLIQKDFTSEELNTIISFVQEQLFVAIPEDFDKYKKDYKVEYLLEKLNRPIRICGMVKNEGEPGGGPFWVKDDKGNISLQIVESSQINLDSLEQNKIFKSSTHFNPVDIVCGLKNYKGEKFNLLEFIDEKTGFLVEKTKDGKPVLAYELPGLWNGAMANWNTLFVEVPLSTFNPVKTVNDLLKPAHQPKNE